MNRIINALRVWFGRDQPAQPTAPIGLRCRPGDLAFVTRDINYLLRGFVYLVPMQDRIVRVTKQSGYLDCWLLDQPAAVSPVTSRCGRNCIEGGLVYAVPDRYLRPIRCDGLGDETPTDAKQPQPADLRAWGKATVMAISAGYIEKMPRVFMPAASSNGSPKATYRKVVKA